MVRKPLRNGTPQFQSNLVPRSMPAPFKGWNARDPEALMQEGYALSMVNCFPSTADVALRAGANVACGPFLGSSKQIKGLLSYSPSVGSPVLFASNDYGIWNANPSTPAAAPVSAHTAGYVQGINFRTTGSSQLLVCNGVDPLRRWNGATWTTDASYSINGGGTLSTNDITNICASNRRLFMTEKGTLDAYCHAVDAVTGAVDRIPLGGLMGKGGTLIACGTWTIDGGAGSSDRTVFVSTKGQVAVYSGTNPADAANWGLVGVYDLAEPLGPNCFLKYGGDLLYLSVNGILPLSQATQNAQTVTGVSDNIRNAFAEAARRYRGNRGWCMVLDEPNNLLVVNVPVTTLGLSVQYVMNLLTKAWCQFTGWNAYSLAYHAGQLYMGRTEDVSRAYSGLNDWGAAIIGTTKGAFSYLGQRGMNKHIELIRPVLKVGGVASAEMAIDTDFRNDASFGPTSFGASGGAVWDVDTWVPDGGAGAVWADDSAIKLNWQTVAHYPGYALAVRLRITSSAAKVSWSATDLQYKSAGPL